MTDSKIIEYKYKIESRETSLLIGENIDCAIDVDGWNIDLIKYEIWSDGSQVQCNRVTITATTNEKEVEYLKSVVKTSVVFSFVYSMGINQSEAYEMFIEDVL